MKAFIFKTANAAAAKTMRIIVSTILAVIWITGYGQFPYVKKLNYPEQLPTQVVYDMLTDSKGYIWMGTDKGLFHFNGRIFVAVPFSKTSLKSVSYLQEDQQGMIWCMNFYNEVFYLKNDTLRSFEIDSVLLKDQYPFRNMLVGKDHIWFPTLSNILKFDKRTFKRLQVFERMGDNDAIISSGIKDNVPLVFSHKGRLFTDSGGKRNGWTRPLGETYLNMKFINSTNGVIALGTGGERTTPMHITDRGCTSMERLKLSPDVYIFQATQTGADEYWLCTQSGAYLWNRFTGDTKCYLPLERVSDVVRDYEGNYWFSTLDNGVFICPSLSNTLHKIYNDPLLDNFIKIAALPSGKLAAGNSHGLLTTIDLEKSQVFHYNLPRSRETEFISYDTIDNLIFTNRGAFKEGRKEPVGLIEYSKGVSRDRFNNLLVAVFNMSLVMNNKFANVSRRPERNCALYLSPTMRYGIFDVTHEALLIRPKRSIAILGAREKDKFWVAYEDGLYEYAYEGGIKILADDEGKPIIGKSLIQLTNGSLVVGTSGKGVIIIANGKTVNKYGSARGLSSMNVRKVVLEDHYIWVLTDAGLDRIDLDNNAVTNYLEEYGLSDIIINDFILQNNKLLFATPTGILERYNKPRSAGIYMQFPLLRALNNGRDITSGQELTGGSRDISFYFEALHYISPAALSYRYRLNGVDTAWHWINNTGNPVNFNRLSPGNYHFQVQAIAGNTNRSGVRSFHFVITRPFWQKWWFWGLVLAGLMLSFWGFLGRWKKRVLGRQSIKEQLLKSQLVALRAQMNPHFLYNVLNTVQGLVYGNRKTEAGVLLGNFSDLMRKVLQSSDKQLLSLADEIENLQLYLELEKARFDEGFSYSIQMINLHDISGIYIPSLLLQPFAENAVKHGLMHKRGTKKLDIRFEKTPDGLAVTIDDDGIGRQRSIEINQRKRNKPTGFATIALNERMELFNRLYSKKIICEITDKIGTDNQPAGTSIQLIIPDYGSDPDAL
jgi:ligand-binding sensor domain-containing protein